MQLFKSLPNQFVLLVLFSTCFIQVSYSQIAFSMAKYKNFIGWQNDWNDNINDNQIYVKSFSAEIGLRYQTKDNRFTFFGFYGQETGDIDVLITTNESQPIIDYNNYAGVSREYVLLSTQYYFLHDEAKVPNYFKSNIYTFLDFDINNYKYYDAGNSLVSKQTRLGTNLGLGFRHPFNQGLAIYASFGMRYVPGLQFNYLTEYIDTQAPYDVKHKRSLFSLFGKVTCYVHPFKFKTKA